MKKKVDNYLEKTRYWKPSGNVTRAVEQKIKYGKALDLDCGSFRNTKYLIDKGYEVDA